MARHADKKLLLRPCLSSVKAEPGLHAIPSVDGAYAVNNEDRVGFWETHKKPLVLSTTQRAFRRGRKKKPWGAE